ncbi:uncharacterized protein CMU_014160 [Cryptosporidium muris RN66]|uniref:Uncharacterized protein n=1 Tax=Cryptosporidium muris (strain RN66) TaxID=441375 RepID=B6AEX3_CRYMR|nr:uncharacterized protein CMU_014160 [Cryptosporidium muris RN66]EEA06740.1 hypothetical protein, conserved [Cryptosporidium muris RN66]|eukprot:XP_002141089.1 hypothetical protein [Cryptosporidium muris RN66]
MKADINSIPLKQSLTKIPNPPVQTKNFNQSTSSVSVPVLPPKKQLVISGAKVQPKDSVPKALVTPVTKPIPKPAIKANIPTVPTSVPESKEVPFLSEAHNGDIKKQESLKYIATKDDTKPPEPTINISKSLTKSITTKSLDLPDVSKSIMKAPPIKSTATLPTVTVTKGIVPAIKVGEPAPPSVIPKVEYKEDIKIPDKQVDTHEPIPLANSTSLSNNNIKKSVATKLLSNLSVNTESRNILNINTKKTIPELKSKSNGIILQNTSLKVDSQPEKVNKTDLISPNTTEVSNTLVKEVTNPKNSRIISDQATNLEPVIKTLDAPILSKLTESSIPTKKLTNVSLNSSENTKDKIKKATLKTYSVFPKYETISNEVQSDKKIGVRTPTFNILNNDETDRVEGYSKPHFNLSQKVNTPRIINDRQVILEQSRICKDPTNGDRDLDKYMSRSSYYKTGDRYALTANSLHNLRNRGDKDYSSDVAEKEQTLETSYQGLDPAIWQIITTIAAICNSAGNNRCQKCCHKHKSHKKKKVRDKHNNDAISNFSNKCEKSTNIKVPSTGDVKVETKTSIQEPIHTQITNQEDPKKDLRRCDGTDQYTWDKKVVSQSNWHSVERKLSQIRGSNDLYEDIEISDINESDQEEKNQNEKIQKEMLRPKYSEVDEFIPDQLTRSRIGKSRQYLAKKDFKNIKRTHKPFVGGLITPRRRPYSSLSEMAAYFANIEPQDQSDVISMLLACRKLEKQIEEQQLVMQMLEHDLREAQSALRFPPEWRMLQKVDVVGPTPGDTGQLPPTSDPLYAQNHPQVEPPWVNKKPKDSLPNRIPTRV